MSDVLRILMQTTTTRLIRLTRLTRMWQAGITATDDVCDDRAAAPVHRRRSHDARAPAGVAAVPQGASARHDQAEPAGVLMHIASLDIPRRFPQSNPTTN
eukprot:2463703-Rhodomonas_salina.7